MLLVPVCTRPVATPLYVPTPVVGSVTVGTPPTMNVVLPLGVPNGAFASLTTAVKALLSGTRYVVPTAGVLSVELSRTGPKFACPGGSGSAPPLLIGPCAGTVNWPLF